MRELFVLTNESKVTFDKMIYSCRCLAMFGGITSGSDAVCRKIWDGEATLTVIAGGDDVDSIQM